MPPTYRDRLRAEGWTLAVACAAAAAALLATRAQARRGPLDTLGQLAMLGAGLATLGRRAVERSLAQARPVADPGDGHPTPLWHVPIPVLALAAFVAGPVRDLNAALGLPAWMARKAGWDAALRATAGGAMVGLWQALVVERAVGRAEQASGRTFYRLAGSRLGRTVLGSSDPG